MSAEPAQPVDLAAAIWDALCEDDATAFDVAARFGVTIEEVQALCGATCGHDMESHYDGDGPWTLYRGTWCEICGAPEGGDDA